jgi:hypothetical protein
MKTMRRLLASCFAAASLAAAVSLATPFTGETRADSSDPNGPECMCRFQGQRYHLGEFACINSRLARCDMFLNNTSWTFLEDSCPTSNLSPLQQSFPILPASYNPVSPPRY